MNPNLGEQELQESMSKMSVSLDLEAMYAKARALKSLWEFSMAASTIEAILELLPASGTFRHHKGDHDGGGFVGELKLFLATCKRLAGECANASYPLEAFALSILPANLLLSQTGELSVQSARTAEIRWKDEGFELADFIGPVELRSGSICTTKFVERGELLFAINPMAYSDDVKTALTQAASKSTRVFQIVTAIFSGDPDRLPDLELLKLDNGITFRLMEKTSDDDVNQLSFPANWESLLVCPSGLSDSCPSPTPKPRGLWHLLTFLKHSCEPNVTVTFVGTLAMVRASRNLYHREILQGSDIKVVLTQYKGLRWSSLGKSCDCKRCTVEPQAPDPLCESILQSLGLNHEDRQRARVPYARFWIHHGYLAHDGPILMPAVTLMDAIDKYANGGYNIAHLLEFVLPLYKYACSCGDKLEADSILRSICVSWYGITFGIRVAKELEHFVDRYI